jgi:hypothetical protein
MAEKKKPSDAPDYRHLPEPVRLEDTVAEQEVRPVPDPDGGKDPEQIFLLRYGAL